MTFYMQKEDKKYTKGQNNDSNQRKRPDTKVRHHHNT